MKICNLGSGSKGNSTFVEHEGYKILIDAGLGFCDLEKRLRLVGAEPSEIKAIVVSHEHIDHIRAIDVFSSRFGTPIFVHADCVQSLMSRQKNIKQSQINLFYDLDFFIGPFTFTPIPVSHDASCCHGFCVCNEEKKFSILTDLGQTNDKILSCVKNSQLIYLESNHDESLLLANKRYPFVLKRRILSCKGHLSNTACAKAILGLYTDKTKQIVLSHLSEENNSPELAYNTVCEILKHNGLVEGENISIDVASQTRPGVIFNLK